MVNKYQCTKCGRKFAEKRYLEQHGRRKVSCAQKYTCSKCFRVFKTQSDLTRHDNRKTPCVTDEIPVIAENNLENRCQYCNNTFATKGSLTRHLKTCNKEGNMFAIMQMLKEIKEDKPGQIVNNITNNNLYVGSNGRDFELCVFGDEDPQLLDIKKMQRLFIDEPQNFVEGVIREYHANPNLPQNHNVYFDVKKEQCMVFTRVMVNGIMVSTWQKKEIKEVSKDLVKKAIRYPTCMPLANGIRPNSAEEQQYCKSLQLITREYEHSDIDVENTKEILTKVTGQPGFFRMITDTTYVSSLLPLIHLN
jgi:hypothetical protein